MQVGSEMKDIEYRLILQPSRCATFQVFGGEEFTLGEGKLRLQQWQWRGKALTRTGPGGKKGHRMTARLSLDLALLRRPLTGSDYI